MSGKQSKKERKELREAQREAERRAERQRTMFTAIVVAIVLGLGGVLIWVSLDADDDPDLADLLEELEGLDATPTPEADDAVDPVDDDRPVACGAAVPPAAGEAKQTYDEPQQILEDGVSYQAIIQTSCGQVVIDLDEQSSPEAVNSFVLLAGEGFFDGLEIFRNATGITALQTGAGDNDNTWSIGYTLTDELETAEQEGYPAGSVAMANSGPDTAGSQFFFVYGEGFDDAIGAGGLQPIYTRFGMVVEGLDVLVTIGEIEVEGERPTERIYMETVQIVSSDQTTPADAEPDAEEPDDAAEEPDDATDE